MTFKKHGRNSWGSDKEHCNQATGKRTPISVPIKWRPSGQMPELKTMV